MDSDFWTLTELGHNYFGGISGKEIGKTLKAAKLRTPDGKPTSTAIELGLTQKFEGPQPWIPLWCPFRQPQWGGRHVESRLGKHWKPRTCQPGCGIRGR